MILDKINKPADVKNLSIDELGILAEEIRQTIIETVYKTGGHLGSNLGVVELTLALHHVFDIDNDMIVWDGSYQTYTHKLLTGRKGQFHTLRQFRGLCGFGWKAESAYDPFNFGHVGTGLAAAYGCSVADEHLNRRRKVVCIVGDGSMTSGVAFEALNNIGASKREMLIVLNDNGFSIAPTVGAISSAFNELRTAPIYDRVKKEIRHVLQNVPMGQTVEHVLDSVRRGFKEALLPNIFTMLGLQYYGPIDGHDLKTLIRVFQNVKNQTKPILLHLVTKKGKGHPDADRDPFALHKPVDPKGTLVQESGAAAPKAKSYTRAFVDALSDLSDRDPRVVAITAAMPDGTGLLDYAKKFPHRMYDVGISEQCAVAFASGLARSGMRPVCAIYSSFNQRAYDQIFQEMCLQNLPVVLALDRAGIAGEDGPTHHGNFDIASLRTFPNMILLAPKDEAEFRAMLEFVFAQDGPSAIRYPRETVPDFSSFNFPQHPIELGKGEILCEGKHGAILAYGVMVNRALEARQLLASEGLDVAVANARFAKPLDLDLASDLVRRYPWVLTVEDHSYEGGFGSAVLEGLSLRNEEVGKVKIHAIPDKFLMHADREDLLRFLSLDAPGIADVIRLIAAGKPTTELVRHVPQDVFCTTPSNGHEASR